MGFGILFVGYFMLCFGISITSTIGFIVMLIAAAKLSCYIDKFKSVKQTLFMIIPLSVIQTVLSYGGNAILGENLTKTVSDITITLISLLMIIMHYYMLNGLYDIAVETSVLKIQKKVKRNIYVSAGYYGVYIIYTFTKSIIPPVVGIFIYLFYVFMIILNSVVIYNSYMYICLEGDEDMSDKDKLWFNRINPLRHLEDKIDAKEEERIRKKYEQIKAKKKKKK